jgi:cobalt/nickel transport system ATP-binding protein
VSTPPIVCDNLHFAYPGGPPVLAGLSLVLEPGDRLGLTGANGCGKSTLLQLLVGLLRPQAGELHILGEPRTTEADFQAVRGRLGLLFQDPDDQLFCATVGEDAAFGPLNQGKPPDHVRTLVAQALDEVGLAGFEARVTYRLSGGEKRLAALAGVLAMKPEVLLLDEPVAGLDEAAAERITRVLAGLSQAMIVVAHDHAFLDAVATRRSRLHQGALVPQTGERDES